jgi:hypothetical protein
MARSARWRTAAVALWIAVLAAVAVFLVAGRPGGEPSASPAAVPASAIGACRLPDTLSKADRTFTPDWQLDVEVDLPTESILYFTSGDMDLLCEANRSSTGGFPTAVLAGGGFSRATTLTYDTRSGPASGERRGEQVVVGQVPPGVATVDITAVDGQATTATIGGGFYVGVLSGGSLPATIVARDAAGRVVATLSNGAGLEPQSTPGSSG